MSFWDWLLSLFRVPDLSPPPAESTYRQGDLVWYLYNPQTASDIPSIEEPVVLKQFQVVEVLPALSGVSRCYRIASGALRLTVHESYLARTAVEAVNAIQVEYISENIRK